MCALPSKRQPTFLKDVVKIKAKIDELEEKIEKKAKFSPSHRDLEKLAKKLITYVNDYHSEVEHHQNYLKAAIIDLTEVPDMSEQMQRVAFSTALKDASKSLGIFLQCW